jgi:hypothetical protein
VFLRILQQDEKGDRRDSVKGADDDVDEQFDNNDDAGGVPMTRRSTRQLLASSQQQQQAPAVVVVVVKDGELDSPEQYARMASTAARSNRATVIYTNGTQRSMGARDMADDELPPPPAPLVSSRSAAVSRNTTLARPAVPATIRPAVPGSIRRLDTARSLRHADAPAAAVARRDDVDDAASDLIRDIEQAEARHQVAGTDVLAPDEPVSVVGGGRGN